MEARPECFHRRLPRTYTPHKQVTEFTDNSRTSYTENLTVPFLRHGEQLAGAEALVRDRGSQFVDAFDEVFRTEHMKILKTPIRTPVASAFAERWIGTLRRELLDRTLIWNRRQLERLVADNIAHYNRHRPHRSLGQQPPVGGAAQLPDRPLRAVKSTRCDGLINEYRNAA